ncbi:amino acid ABC transporter ATP-binding protein [Desulforamulus ruminis]|uniref:ABC transporter related protein n=1 Tax=Desulforamulus ruminis (strain ATCC 23193 / DSM 2154 / NCIMB 8452 / DL) TaxID=696281 RepID=F6DKJ2_DESRL|nr:amino acid ABC transporter ATP-binding protein [Desulforamulus ruminis]AEG59252.1 ABC transporter related protein [Desulforamulus ruminis DSM 2154]
MNLLEIKNIRKSFEELEVLKDISLTVKKGQVLAIIGPSGSGKSTLLRCATLLERVDSGSIYYKGEPMVVNNRNGQAVYSEPAQLKKIRSYFGLVFQNFNLFPHFSVLRNITEAPIHVAGQRKEQALETALDLLRQMGLEDKAEAYPYQLSGGQQQRVSIARALALQPDVLFFDEPTSALDPELTGEILKVIRELAGKHMTMVIVTHEMDFAREVADHIIFMDGGVIVEQGKAFDLVNNPQQERTKLFLKRLGAE